MFRGGQIFVVCPRIDYMQRVHDRIRRWRQTPGYYQRMGECQISLDT